MSAIPLTRCQFLIPFTIIHDEIGASTAPLLARHGLPTSLEEKADHFVPLLRAVGFAEAAQRSQGIVDIGFLASQRLEYCHLSEKLRAVIGYSPTLFAALQQMCKWATLEDNVLHMWLERCDDHVKICSTLLDTSGIAHLEHSQWLQNVFPVHIVRQFAGSGWAPATMAFEARYTPSAQTRSCWPNTRFLSDQEMSWIDVPVSLLGLPNLAKDRPASPADDEAGPSGGDIIDALRLMLPSYLDDGALTVAEVAEMAGISVRSLQRKLSGAGLSYSDLLASARFENAARLLRDTNTKIIEVAFSSGYADPAHFSRAFRRISGVTPRQFREQWRPR
jgi:AraC-like DNA-binding protein